MASIFRPKDPPPRAQELPRAPQPARKPPPPAADGQIPGLTSPPETGQPAAGGTRDQFAGIPSAPQVSTGVTNAGTEGLTRALARGAGQTALAAARVAVDGSRATARGASTSFKAAGSTAGALVHGAADTAWEGAKAVAHTASTAGKTVHAVVTAGRLPVKELSEAVKAHKATVAAATLAGIKDIRTSGLGRLSAKAVVLTRRALHYVNLHVMPKLHTEEAAAEVLGLDVAYSHLMRDQDISLEVTHRLPTDSDDSWDETRPLQPVTQYAKRYKVSDLVTNEDGLAAYLLAPVDAKEGDRSIILFRGTDRDLGRKGGSGVRTDLDRRGVGATAYAKEAARLEAWAQATGGNVTIIGHSLGGALATRLYAHLSPEEQQVARLITFGAPPIDRKTVARIDPDAAQTQVTRIYNRQDPVVRGGVAHPPGQVFRTEIDRSSGWARFDPFAPHMGAALTDQGLSGNIHQVTQTDRHAAGGKTHHRQGAAEAGRRILGALRILVPARPTTRVPAEERDDIYAHMDRVMKPHAESFNQAADALLEAIRQDSSGAELRALEATLESLNQEVEDALARTR